MNFPGWKPRFQLHRISFCKWKWRGSISLPLSASSGCPSLVGSLLMGKIASLSSSITQSLSEGSKETSLAVTRLALGRIPTMLFTTVISTKSLFCPGRQHPCCFTVLAWTVFESHRFSHHILTLILQPTCEQGRLAHAGVAWTSIFHACCLLCLACVNLLCPFSLPVLQTAESTLWFRPFVWPVNLSPESRVACLLVNPEELPESRLLPRQPAISLPWLWIEAPKATGSYT